MIQRLNKRHSPEQLIQLFRKLNIFSTRTLARAYFEEKIMSSFKPLAGEKVLIIGFHHASIQYSYFYHSYGIEPVMVDYYDGCYRNQGIGKSIQTYVQNIDQHFNSELFALIDFNGVYGYGVNSKDDLKITTRKLFNILKPGGHLLFGHNLRGVNPLEPSYGNPLKLESTYKEYFSQFDEVTDEVVPKFFENNIYRVFTKTI